MNEFNQACVWIQGALLLRSPSFPFSNGTGWPGRIFLRAGLRGGFFFPFVASELGTHTRTGRQEGQLAGQQTADSRQQTAKRARPFFSWKEVGRGDWQISWTDNCEKAASRLWSSSLETIRPPSRPPSPPPTAFLSPKERKEQAPSTAAFCLASLSHHPFQYVARRVFLLRAPPQLCALERYGCDALALGHWCPRSPGM